MANGITRTIAQLDDILLRPYRQLVDIETVVLALALLLVAAGGWHLVLENVEIGSMELDA